MVNLFQFPWSPYCLVQKRILDYAAIPHTLVQVSPTDRTVIWELTHGAYYQVPVLKHGQTVVWDHTHAAQDIGQYLDKTFQLDLFPTQWNGIQQLLWRYIEDEVEGVTFKLNDVHYREFVKPEEQMPYLRHKERKFGPYCIEEWRRRKTQLLHQLRNLLIPFEAMLHTRPYLLDQQPRFLDFDLWGMLANLTYTGNYVTPGAHPRIRKWFNRMSTLRADK